VESPFIPGSHQHIPERAQISMFPPKGCSCWNPGSIGLWKLRSFLVFLGEASKGYAVGGWRYIKDPGISKDIAAPKIILEGSNLFIVYIYIYVCVH